MYIFTVLIVMQANAKNVECSFIENEGHTIHLLQVLFQSQIYKIGQFLSNVKGSLSNFKLISFFTVLFVMQCNAKNVESSFIKND